MSSRTFPDRWIGLACLGVTAVGWALNWPGMKVLLRDWPPLFSRGVAGVSAALLLALVALWKGEHLGVPRAAIGRLLFASFTNVFAWMGFGTMAMVWLRVGEGALIAYTMPIWATLLSWPILGARPTLRDVAALVLGMTGVGIVLTAQGFDIGGAKLLGAGLALAAAIPFALGTVLNRAPMPIAPTALAAWQVGLGCLPMLVIGLLFEKPDFTALSPTGMGVMIYMTFIPMGLCYLTWFAALRKLPPATASTAMLLVPLLGVIFAALLIGEPLGLREISALALTLAGITLALQKS